jgi:hypothetical protein
MVVVFQDPVGQVTNTQPGILLFITFPSNLLANGNISIASKSIAFPSEVRRIAYLGYTLFQHLVGNEFNLKSLALFLYSREKPESNIICFISEFIFPRFDPIYFLTESKNGFSFSYELLAG